MRSLSIALALSPVAADTITAGNIPANGAPSQAG